MTHKQIFDASPFGKKYFETWTSDDGVVTARRTFNWRWTITRSDIEHYKYIVNNRAEMEWHLNLYEDFEKNHEQKHV